MLPSRVRYNTTKQDLEPVSAPMPPNAIGPVRYDLQAFIKDSWTDQWDWLTVRRQLSLDDARGWAATFTQVTRITATSSDGRTVVVPS